MKLTVMNQMIKGLSSVNKEAIEKELERIKWYLWHGNLFKALQTLENLSFETEAGLEEQDNKEINFWKAIDEFYDYINSNRNFIVNYGERYHHGEIIATGFVESTVNELISKRMVKKQQMRWTKKGAHHLLQVRVKTLNEELRECFCEWYPGMGSGKEELGVKVA